MAGHLAAWYGEHGHRVAAYKLNGHNLAQKVVSENRKTDGVVGHRQPSQNYFKL